jgi:N-acetylglutamate synthase
MAPKVARARSCGGSSSEGSFVHPVPLRYDHACLRRLAPSWRSGYRRCMSICGVARILRASLPNRWTGSSAAWSSSQKKDDCDSMKPRALEELALTAWPALQQWLYDGWVVRFADGHTRRANSVNPLYSSHQEPAAKIAQCEQWYAARNLPTVFRLNRHTAPSAIDRLLDARGYRLVDPSLTLHRRLDDWRMPRDLRGAIRSEVLPDWLALYYELSGKALHQQHTHMAILQATPAPRIFAALRDGDQVVACAVGVVYAQALSIVDVVTSPQHRQRGYATALLSQIFAWAQRAGATHAALQVQGDNSAGRALYARLGFQAVYRYWYRVSP